MSVLVVDNLSPFTPEILKCIQGLGIKSTHRNFFEVSESDLSICKSVILSGRRKNSKEINAANSKIVRHCQTIEKPLLGICYGAEIIALTLGGSIRKMPSHVQGTTFVNVLGLSPLTQAKRRILVYESHGYCIARLPERFKSLASSQYCEHEIFSDGKIFGTQFHPEKSGNDGLDLLENFTKI